MRGSPLIRTIFVILALAVSAIGFARLTYGEAKVPEHMRDADLSETGKPEVTARYFLSLSSVASSVSLAGKPIEPNAAGDFVGTLEIDKETPVVFLEVKWKEGAGPRRFAKLVIEAAGQETFTKVFDAPGDIDDFVELPF